MRLSRTTALCVGCLISLAAGGVSATLPILLGGMENGAVYFEPPDAFGSWMLQQPLELTDDEIQMLGAARYWRRQYQCQRTQQSVVATLAAGPPGRIAAHSPEICYAAHDYQSISTARTIRVDGVEGRFWVHRFRPRTAGQPTLTVAYAWHDGHCWRAPRSPRWELVGTAQICRLQVSCQHPDWDTGDAAAALTDFLQQALVDFRGEPNPNLLSTTPDADVQVLATAASPEHSIRVRRSSP